jgi:hypothetical protein
MEGEQRLELPLGSEPIAAQIFFGGGDRVGRPFISGQLLDQVRLGAAPACLRR